MVLTLASVGLPTTSGFTGEFLVLLGAFNAAWPHFLMGDAYPVVVSASAVTGVVLGALYMLRLAQSFLYGEAKAPHMPLVDLDLREKAILASIVIAIFAVGLFPDEPMRKTELAAKEFQQLAGTPRTPVASAAAATASAEARMNEQDLRQGPTPAPSTDPDNPPQELSTLTAPGGRQ
jgi:NADH-quinone oxidoreductase subunit M